jgi:hypothetical protein
MSKIMLSYSRTDEATVKVLVQGFEAAKRDVWFDHNLDGGDAWWDSILANIRSAAVFLFALSDASLHSKPCRLELDYALALGRPILPVQVGPVTSFRANPLAALQIITYDPGSARSGFAILAAVDAAAQRERPLPDPLPPAPPIPFGYLLALGRQIDSTELSVGDQVAVVDQLRRALGEETDEAARRDVLSMLANLSAKPWATRRTEREIAALLYVHGPTAPPGADVGDAARPGSPAEPAATPAASAPASPDADPDPREWFAERLEQLQRQRAAAERAADPDPPPWRPPPDAAAQWSRTFAQEERPGPAAGRASAAGPPGPNATPPPAHRTAPAPPRPGPQPAPQPGTQPPAGRWPTAPPPSATPPPAAASPSAARQPFASQPTAPPAANQPRPPAGGAPPQVDAPPGAAPRSHLAMSIVACLLSVSVAGAALHFSSQVDRRYAAGDLDGARRASGKARIWGIFGIAAAPLVWLVVGLTGLWIVAIPVGGLVGLILLLRH